MPCTGCTAGYTWSYIHAYICQEELQLQGILCRKQTALLRVANVMKLIICCTHFVCSQLERETERQREINSGRERESERERDGKGIAIKSDCIFNASRHGQARNCQVCLGKLKRQNVCQLIKRHYDEKPQSLKTKSINSFAQHGQYIFILQRGY